MPVERVDAALDTWLEWHVGRVVVGLLAAVLVAAFSRRGHVARQPEAERSVSFSVAGSSGREHCGS